MRIVLANTGHPATIKGGAEAAVLDLARRLAARGHSVALVVHHDGAAPETSEDGGVRVYALPNRNLYFGFDGIKRPAPARLAWHALDSFNPFMAAAFGRILDRERPDVVNTHVLAGLSPALWLAAKRRRVPVVHYLHEYGALCPRGSAFQDGKLCAKPCGACGLIAAPRKRLSRLVDAVIGVSRFTLRRHLDWGYFPNAAATVIPNVFEGLAPGARREGASTTLRLGYFGRLIPDKGAHLLVEAAGRLPPTGWSLDIAGTGDESYVEHLRRIAPPSVRFLGWTRPGTFFPEIDLLVLPSIWPDPQPRVVFEAYAHGVPVLGATAGGIPEQIDEGRTGWLFEGGSVDALARALAARHQDRADLRLGQASFAARLGDIAPDRVAERYESVFRAAIVRSPQLLTNALSTDKLAEHSENG